VLKHLIEEICSCIDDSSYASVGAQVEIAFDRIADHTWAAAALRDVLIDVSDFGEAECGYKLSKNQKIFVRDAQECGLEVDYDYSGRAMNGRDCPAVRVDSPNELTTRANYSIDSMGVGLVLYARR